MVIETGQERVSGTALFVYSEIMNVRLDKLKYEIHWSNYRGEPS